MQFWWTMGLFNTQKFLKCNMNQSLLSDITMCQCHIATFYTCSSLVLLHLVLFLCFTFLSWQLRIQILKLALAVRLLFICILLQYYIWSYNHTINLSSDIEKNPGLRPSSSQKIFNLSSEPKQYKSGFLCKNFPFKSLSLSS